MIMLLTSGDALRTVSTTTVRWGPMIAGKFSSACRVCCRNSRSTFPWAGERLITSSDSEIWELITSVWVAALFEAEDIGPKVGLEVT